MVSPTMDDRGRPRMAIIIIGPKAVTNDPFGKIKVASIHETAETMIRKTMPATRRARL